MEQRVGEFEKVSFEQFCSAMKDTFYNDQELPEAIISDLREMWDGIQLPNRATTGSAGYDFKSPFSFTLEPGATIKIPTGIRARIEDGWFLACFPRSGLGFKYRLQLDCTVGIIDADYVLSDNEGHIFAKITNDGHEGKPLLVKCGDGFMQGIFLPFGITYYDRADGVRNGGFGSTGR